MTTQLLAPAPFAQFQTLGAAYTADAKGVIAAAAIDDVADLIRGGCTLLPAYHNLFATTDPGASNDHSQDYSVGSRWVDGTIRNNSVGWQLTANVFKYGAAGANTQYAQGSAILGGIHGGISAPLFMTAVESDAIVIAVTGSSFTSGVANDVVATWFEIDAMN
jgi:hypothetical protein